MVVDQTVTPVVKQLDIATHVSAEPKSIEEESEDLIEALWSKKTTDGLGTRSDTVQQAFAMSPGQLRDDQERIPAL